MFIEALKLVGILLAIMVMYIISGIVCNVLINGDKFDWKILLVGIIKALVACISLIVLANVASSDLIDLSSIGFVPKTFISSGIILYGGKLLKNITKLIGIGASTNSKESSDDDIIESVPEFFKSMGLDEDVKIDNKAIEEAINDNEVKEDDTIAVG